MTLTSLRCLVLACGNALRSDDGVGPWLAEWAEKRFRGDGKVRVVIRQQWTPELAEAIAGADSVLFVDCAVDLPPGSIQLIPVASQKEPTVHGASHQFDAAGLLTLARELYHAKPAHTLLLKIGAGSTELGETFSGSLNQALPKACTLLEETVLCWLYEGVAQSD